MPRSNGKSPWQRAQEQWRSDTGFSEGDGAGASLALRGRDPFGDGPDERELGEEFRRIAAIVFDAVVRGRDAEATA